MTRQLFQIKKQMTLSVIRPEAVENRKTYLRILKIIHFVTPGGWLSGDEPFLRTFIHLEFLLIGPSLVVPQKGRIVERMAVGWDQRWDKCQREFHELPDVSHQALQRRVGISF